MLCWKVNDNPPRPEVPDDIFDDDALREYSKADREWQRLDHERRVAAALSDGLQPVESAAFESDGVPGENLNGSHTDNLF